MKQSARLSQKNLVKMMENKPSQFDNLKLLLQKHQKSKEKKFLSPSHETSQRKIDQINSSTLSPLVKMDKSSTKSCNNLSTAGYLNGPKQEIKQSNLNISMPPVNISQNQLRASTGLQGLLYKPKNIHNNFQKNNQQDKIYVPLQINRKQKSLQNQPVSVPKIDFTSLFQNGKSKQHPKNRLLDEKQMRFEQNKDIQQKTYQLTVDKKELFKTKSLGKNDHSNTSKSHKVPAFIKSKHQQVKFQQVENHIHSFYQQKIQVVENQEDCLFPAITISIKPALKRHKIEDFLIIKELGKGSFGKACLAVQKSIGFICVLKIIEKIRINQYEIDCLMRQIKIQTYLDHKHITSMYGFFDDEQYLYLILELLPTGNLQDQTKNKAMPQKLVSNVILQVCSAISQMHSHSILHRDIKPENIFTCYNYIKLGDFGCAVYSEQTRRSFVGSPCYLSPQQLRNQSYDGKIDVWQIGTLTYELLYKKCPYEKDIMEMMQGTRPNILSKLEFPQKVNISEQTKDFIRKTLNKNSQERISITQALNHKFLKHNNDDFQSAKGII